MSQDCHSAKETRMHFAISDEAITRIANNRARQCNGLATEFGQQERLKASELIDLYFQQHGLCPHCKTVLEESNIQLDHIVECNYRAHRRALVCGQDFVAGKVACIHNAQWLCRFCNRFKENCRANGINMIEYVGQVFAQAQNGFPLRKACKHLGTSGARDVRIKEIKEALAANPRMSAREMCERLEGTIAESSYACVIQHMKECGWSGGKGDASSQRKLNAVKAVFAMSSEWASKSSLVDALNENLGETLSSQGWNKWIIESGVRFSFATTRGFAATCRTRVSAGDKQTVLLVMRGAGRNGMLHADIVGQCDRRGMNSLLTQQAIEMLTRECAIYSRDLGKSLVAALTRKEAAKQIGVSWLRLKKWAAEEFAHLNAGPAYMKASPKALTYYRHEDVEQFIRARERTKYDLTGAQGTHEGGHCGGRPPVVRLCESDAGPGAGVVQAVPSQAVL